MINNDYKLNPKKESLNNFQDTISSTLEDISKNINKKLDSIVKGALQANGFTFVSDNELRKFVERHGTACTFKGDPKQYLNINGRTILIYSHDKETRVTEDRINISVHADLVYQILTPFKD